MEQRRLSKRAYARHRKGAGLPGGSLRAVQLALEAKRIDEDADGKIDPVAADASWDVGVSPDAKVRRDVAAITRGAPSPKSAGTKANKGFLAARARTEEARAGMAELDLAERRGELVLLADVVQGWSRQITTVRSKFLAMPHKLAPRVVDVSVFEAQKLIRAEIYEALTELAHPKTRKKQRKGKTSNK
jgi:hypothetical protein